MAEQGQEQPALLPRVRAGAKVDRICDLLTEILLYAMVLFGPWAFGTTERWSIWTMTVAGYVMGLILITKWLSRWRTGWRPEWCEKVMGRGVGGRWLNPRRVTWLLGSATVLILGYCLTSALNARASYDPWIRSFDYHPNYIKWLPHTYDRIGTWLELWNYLGSACFFWAIWDWFMNGSTGDRTGAHERSRRPGLLPARVVRLLTVLSVNGAVLGVEGLFQRLEGSGKLLWIVQPEVNPGAASQFGPYAYRANAAQYLNLIWPICLGLWLHSQEAGARGGRRGQSGWHHLLLLCLVIIGACPLVATTRGGAFIAVLNVIVAAAILVTALRRGHWGWQLGVVCFFGLVLGVGLYLGWEDLAPRVEANTITANLAGREESYAIGRQIANDHPLFGTGAATFSTLFQIYRPSPDDFWLAQMHNDWLETRITFGWLGSGLIGIALLSVFFRWFLPGGIGVSRYFVMLLWLSLGGCLLHARFDFPFQIHSVVSLFLLLCALLFCFSSRPLRGD